MCTWLLDGENANLNARGSPYGSPLQAALSNEYMYEPEDVNNRVNIIEMFLRRGAAVDSSPLEPPPGEGDAEGWETAAQCTPLLLAVQRSSKLGHMLLDAGADVNLVSASSELYSPLQAAARYMPSLLSALIARGADVNATGGKLGTALHAAAYTHNAETLRLLLAHGANVNATAGRYGSAAQAAAKWNTTSTGSWTSGRQSVAALEVLLSAGADVNAPGGKYGSPLQMAAKSGNMEAVKWLLAHGADVDARGGKYGGVREAAREKKQWRVLSYLWRLYGKE